MSKYTPQSGIYLISNLKTKKVYIGQSQDLRTRWINHKRSLNLGQHYNHYFQRAWNKYGEKMFKFRVLEYCSVEELNQREQHYLNIYIPQGKCYNIALDATAPMRGRTHKHSNETKRKMSAKAKGRVFTEEHKQRLSEAQKKRNPASEETRQKISQALKGKPKPPVTDEARHKMSEAHKGKTLSEEQKKSMSIAQKGRPHASPSAETRIKIGNATRGRKHTPEAIEKIRQASLKQWAEKKR